MALRLDFSESPYVILTAVSTREIPSPVNAPSGCSFHLRCPARMEVCSRVDPVMVEVEEGHAVRCHLYGQSEQRSGGC
jgi:oligopeptide/dipeptide ABC transporter ATP-binding protein